MTKVLPASAALEHLLVVLCLQGSAGDCCLAVVSSRQALTWLQSCSHPVSSGTLAAGVVVKDCRYWVQDCVKLLESCIDLEGSGLCRLAARSCLLLCLAAVAHATSLGGLAQKKIRRQPALLVWLETTWVCCRSLQEPAAGQGAGACGWAEDRAAALVFGLFQWFEAGHGSATAL